MGGTMGRLSIGVTGLQTSQYALNTTAHNLMNTQTEGYTRQQVMLTDRTYNTVARNGLTQYKVGLGVVTAEVQQARDTFADEAYRAENGRLSYYKAQYEAISEIENYFGELEGQDFNTTMNELWLSLQELQKESNSIVTRSSFISTAQTFLDRVQEIRFSLITYQRNMNTEIKNQISRINELGKTIEKYNEEILSAEAAGVENANDYRDIRNSALDELSGLVKTDYVTNKDGTIEVYIEGGLFVTKGHTYELDSVRVNEFQDYVDEYDFITNSTDYLMPIWKESQDPLFSIRKLPSTEANTDVGALKGLMMSRGYFISNYTDIPQLPEKPLADDFTNDADYQAAMTQYEADMTQYADDLDFYKQYVEPYTVTNLLAQFDVLVNAMVTGINDCLCPNKDVELADGTVITILDEEKAGIGMGYGNEYPGTELFVRDKTPRYTEQTVTLADGTVQTVQVFNKEDKDSYYSLYSINNLSVNEELLKNPSLLPLTRETGEEAQESVDAMLNLWENKFATVSPNSLIKCNFNDYYAGMIEDLSDKGYTCNAMAETQQQTINDIENLRQGVVGVSSDEELSNMIRFQHAYNASSRYISTVSEMLEHIINTLGM